MPANNLYDLFPGLKLGAGGTGAMQINGGDGLAWANRVTGADGRQYNIELNTDTGGYDLYPADWKPGELRMQFGQDGSYKNSYGMQEDNWKQMVAQWALSAGAMAMGLPGTEGFGGSQAVSGMDLAADTPGFGGSYAGGIAPTAPITPGTVGAGSGAVPTVGAGGGGAGGIGAAGGVSPAGAATGFSIDGALKAVAPSIISGVLNNNAAKDAAGIQAGAAQAGIDENRRQFDTVRGLLQPYVDAGGRGLNSYEALAGTLGPQAQQAAIAQLQGTPMWGSTVKAGEDAILQNVAATGGLRGGNVQDALAKFRSGLLTDQVNQSLGRYGNLASMGQNSAVGVGNSAMTTGNNVAQLLGQQGAANAGGVLAGNRAIVNTIGGVGGMWASQPSGGFSMPSTVTPSGMQATASQTSVGSSGFGSGLAYGNQDLGAYF